jgi:hypothetical protein
LAESPHVLCQERGCRVSGQPVEKGDARGAAARAARAGRAGGPRSRCQSERRGESREDNAGGSVRERAPTPAARRAADRTGPRIGGRGLAAHWTGGSGGRA